MCLTQADTLNPHNLRPAICIPYNLRTPQSADPASLRLERCYTPFGQLHTITLAIRGTILLCTKISRL